jgi:hypothetical protein
MGYLTQFRHFQGGKCHHLSHLLQPLDFLLLYHDILSLKDGGIRKNALSYIRIWI